MLRRTLLAVTLAALAVPAAMPATAVTIGDDGLHKAPFLHDTFRDLREDLADATAQGKRLMVIVEQRGCIYCKKMHEEVFVEPAIEKMLNDDFYVVQMNLFGSLEVTDFDGTTLPEKDMAGRWGIMFTPTMMFFPEEVPDGQTAAQAAIATVPGAFGTGTVEALLVWVRDKTYENGENFQKFLAERMAAAPMQ